MSDIVYREKVADSTLSAGKKREMVQRFFRDPAHWIESCLKIRTKEGALVAFKLNVFQRELVEIIQRDVEEKGHCFLVVLKGRQLGISSISRAMMLWTALHKEGKNCILSAHGDEDTKLGMTVIREMVASIDGSWGYSCPSPCNDYRIMWRSTGSMINPRLATGKTQARGNKVNFAHLTEVDYYDSANAGAWERFKSGLLPAVNRVKGAVVIAESTCQGRKALYDLYLNSLQPNSRWRHIFFEWFREPNYTTTNRYELNDFEKEKQEKHGLTDGQIHFWAEYARECGQLAAMREYPFTIEDAFAVSGSKSLFSTESVEQSMKRPIWELQEREPVVMGIDPSRLRDKSGVAIRQGKNMIDVLEMPPFGDVYELVEVVKHHINDYKASIINCDSGSLGGPFIDVLQRLTGRHVNPVDFNQTPDNKEKYANKRAEMYDQLRKWLAAGGRLPPNYGLTNELLSIDINTKREGKLLLEPKHKLTQSPNMADACALTMTHDPYWARASFGQSISIKPWR